MQQLYFDGTRYLFLPTSFYLNNPSILGFIHMMAGSDSRPVNFNSVILSSELSGTLYEDSIVAPVQRSNS